MEDRRIAVIGRPKIYSSGEYVRMVCKCGYSPYVDMQWFEVRSIIKECPKCSSSMIQTGAEIMAERRHAQ